ncbi:MAG TPA: 50S ribosomal protein L15 [Parachlamydiaceae bacterium]|nr:50S ribosomal protein L15 [Parachlamydiaceae bacterium]
MKNSENGVSADNLNSLKDVTRYRKKVRRKGRGPGCGKGKTCGRGEKGAGSRSGYKRRDTYEGGQFRTFMKMPIRGFSNARFAKRLDAINLDEIDALYQDGEVVNAETLIAKGLISTKTNGIKVLGNGELTKKVTLDVHSVSDSAKQKLQQAKIAFTVKK